MRLIGKGLKLRQKNQPSNRMQSDAAEPLRWCEALETYLMSRVTEESVKIIVTLGNLFKREGSIPEFEVLSTGKCLIESITNYMLIPENSIFVVEMTLPVDLPYPFGAVPPKCGKEFCYEKRVALIQ